MISANPNWENAGVFSERATGLNVRERSKFRRMLSKCRKKNVVILETDLTLQEKVLVYPSGETVWMDKAKVIGEDQSWRLCRSPSRLL